MNISETCILVLKFSPFPSTFLQNNTVWELDPCTTCSCLGDLVICEPKQCQDPRCDFQRGERLRIEPNRCCPDCAPGTGSCEYEGEIVGHNSQWSISPCRSCYCNNGVVQCRNQSCGITQCTPDEVLHQVQDECCPRCIRPGRPCTYRGVPYRDGAEWSPVKCTKCRCDNGKSRCFVADCPPLFCSQNEEAVTQPGKCCPMCVGRSCELDGLIYKDGSQWQADPCTYCKCYAGSIECKQQRCAQDFTCRQGDTKVTKEGQCCPECVSNDAPCEDTGTLRYSGDVWNVSACEFCICHQGRIECHMAECDRLRCEVGESLVHREGRCCPECSSPVGYCVHDRITYTNGDTWEPDNCRTCVCEAGRSNCFKVDCPPCPGDRVPVEVEGQCCPDCVLVQCRPDCLTCNANGCTACRNQRLVQDGRCVDSCDIGFYKASQTLCQACHETCLSCTAGTEFHCLTCTDSLLLKWSQCVPDCGSGFFEMEGICLECHESCQECTGPRKSDCLVCSNSTHVIRRNSCVPECGQDYYLQDNYCYPCDSSCLSCHYDNPRCVICPANQLLQDGSCVTQCGAGFYEASNTHCEACHHTCQYCRGPSIYECMACDEPFHLQDGQCLYNCSNGFFDNQSTCTPCHPSCRTCLGPSASDCSSCRDATQVVQGRPPFYDVITGPCNARCQLSFYADVHGVCIPCNPTCLTCTGQTIDSCTSCRTPLLLQNGRCEKQCMDGQYAESAICLDCHPSCRACYGPATDQCLACHRSDTLRLGTCVAGCPGSQFPNDFGVCQDCSSACGTCFASAEGVGSSLCTECVDTGVYPLEDTCVSECGIGHFLDLTTNMCKACHISCRTCTGPGVFDCSTCYSGIVLTHNGMCSSKCYGGYYNDGGVCRACQPNCLECETPYECLVCRNPDDVLQFGECTPYCADQYYLDPITRLCRECDWSCNACSGPTAQDCTLCMENKMLKDGACVSACDEGYYEFAGECRECGEDCKTCSSPGVCTSCQPPRLLLVDQCVSHCGVGFYSDYGRHVCRECPWNCVECSTPDQCTNCASGSFLLKGSCVSDCPSGYFTNPRQNICEANLYPPTLFVNGTLNSEIGGTTVLDTSFFTAYDPDTASADLTFVLMSPPTNGELIKIDRGVDVTLNAGDFFTFPELEQGSVRFVHDRRQQLMGFFSIKVSDRQFESPTEDIGIIILSPLPPYVTRNQLLVVEEGEMGRIASDTNLHIRDEDNPERVTITAIEGPRHGRLIKLPDRTRAKTFTLNDLVAGNIRYAHDGSETQYDAIAFQVTDGHNVINVLFYIQINPNDNKGPILINNVLMQVHEGDLIPITSDHLKAFDVDSPDNELMFILTPPKGNPRSGDIVMILPIPDTGVPSGWEDMQNNYMMKPLTRFAQEDIDQGKIYYRHSGGEVTSDYFMFEVADTAHNVLSDQAFNIEVLPSNDEPPRLVAGIVEPLLMRVFEGEISPITNTHLAYTDIDSSDPDLVYNITTSLQVGQGSIEFDDRPFQRVDLFTQADINAEKIVYRPPNIALGTEPLSFKFFFTVADSVPGGNMVGPNPFTIFVIPSEDKTSPIFENRFVTFEVQRGGLKQLRSILAEGTDLDTPQTDLVYTLITAPEHGFILKSGFIQLDEDAQFTHAELLQESFHYVHDSSQTEQDGFEITLSDGTHSASVVMAVVVTYTDTRKPYVRPGSTLSLMVPENSIVVVTRDELSFEDDDSIDSEIVLTLDTLPHSGRLQRRIAGDYYQDIPIGGTFTQADISAYNIRYVAEGEIGSQAVTDLLFFNVSDASGNILVKQVFPVTVTPVNDQPPSVTVNGDGIVLIEGARELISSANIRATDLDTRLSQLKVIIDSGPTFGFIENIKSAIGSEQPNVDIPVTDFRVQDLIDNTIYYVNSVHRNVEPTQDGFLFHVSDEENESPQYRFNITIKLVNDEEPMLITDTLFLPENEGAVVTNVSMYASDLDTGAEDLIFTVTEYPTCGTLRRREFIGDPLHFGRILTVGDTFTWQDVLNELVVYVHDGSEVKTDSFSVSLTDGLFTVLGTVPVQIGLINDETPRMAVNRGLRVQIGSTTPITNYDLRAEDVDSENMQLIYTLTAEPTVGQLQFLRNGENVVRLTVNGAMSSFTQTDIDNGYIRYVHDLIEAAGTAVFKFTLSDPEGNELIDQSFLITVLEDRVPPQVLANRGLTLAEGTSKVITTSILSSTDVDSVPGNLVYFISAGPTYGQLEHVDIPGVPITEFTQSDLASKTVSYMHTSEEEAVMDSFTFTVDDGTNQVTQTFYITLTPVDDSLPLLTNLGMRVQEGVRKSITEFELKAEDMDTVADSIMFTIFRPPRHGTIDYTPDEIRYAPTLTFSMADVYENRISYNHDGSNTLQDSFEFTVSDGTNPLFTIEQGTELITTSAQQTFQITVLPVDDGTPRIITNLGLSYLEYLDDQAMSIITRKNLATMDADTVDNLLVYSVRTQPNHGILESTLTPGTPITVFTQQDVNNGIIRYTLDPGAESELADRFVFDVSDSKPNTVSGTVFRIRWSLIHLEKGFYNVSETAGVISVPVKRSGNLNQYAIVLCRTEPGYATSVGSQPGQRDYIEQAVQVQFEEREDTKLCTIVINDDTVFEGLEDFIVELSMPAYALLGEPRAALVNIVDDEDEPSIEFDQLVFHVNESSGFLFAPVSRKGDSSRSVSAICFTIPGTATGSSLTGLESGSDYKSRGMDGEFRVVFPAGVNKASCDVKIIDDAMFEAEEQFEIALAMPSLWSKLGKKSRATVVINGPNDESDIFLSRNTYIFNENAGTVEIEVMRHGSDLSHTSMVWCSVKPSDPPSATQGLDFVPSTSQLTFGPQQTVEVCRVTILDDAASPQMEGNETFIVYLSSAMGSGLATPYEAVVVINDTVDDIPTMQFSITEVKVEEHHGLVHIPIVRSGDLSFESSVRCFTRQRSASVMMDYDERRNTDEFRVVFSPGEKVKNCTVGIVDDQTYEADEQFQVRLGDPIGSEFCHAQIGKNSSTLITILDTEDAPTIQFERVAYSVREPSDPEEMSVVTLTVIRTGDQNRTSRVRTSTRDGSAKSGVDYEAHFKVIRFRPGVRSVDIDINIMYNKDMEWHETFSVVLGPDDPVNALLGPITTATVTIIDEEAAGSVVLPSTPLVVSLMDYDDIADSLDHDPSPGYPLICVTPCDPHYPDYSMTRAICEEAGINISNIHYNWEVAMPTDAEGSRAPFERIVDYTPFTTPNEKVLDGVYFSRRFHVRCIAQPYDKSGRPGVPLRSNIVVIGTDNGICHTPVTAGVSRGIQAQSFIANLRYVDPTDQDHPNTLHVSVEIPHQDGMLPAISTIPIHNIRLLLTEPIYRQQHICSSLINNPSWGGLTDYSFLTPVDLDSLVLVPGNNYPYQFDPELRGQKALNLYQHLNLKSCTWTFDAYYHMTELIDLCGGAVTTDFQVRDTDESYLTVTVPLYVSYIYVTAPTGWGALDHRTEMEFSFFYKTILWRTGLETDSVLSGRLEVLRIRIGDRGNLIIDFKTTTKYRGLFVMDHHTLPDYVSRVVPPTELGVGFTLEQLWSEGTFDSPQQLWRATSTYNLKDYSGDYVIELLPCTVTPTQSFNLMPDMPVVCTAHPPEKFVVPIAFQQTNRPVPVVYSLSTEFHLMNNEKVFLMNPNDAAMSLQEMDFKGSFAKGQKIFGRVLWNPDQDLDRAYKLQIEKLYLCTGADGFVPYYDPGGQIYKEGPQFGCMQENRKLKHRFLILDRGDTDAVTSTFNDVPFAADFAGNTENYNAVSNMPGVDGFTMLVDPLYKVQSGHQWYMQVIYTIGPSDTLPRFRRSLLASVSNPLNPNSHKPSSHHNGTNIKSLLLNDKDFSTDPEGNASGTVVPAVVGLLVFIALLSVIIILVAKRRRRRREESNIKRHRKRRTAGGKPAAKVTNQDAAFAKSKPKNPSPPKLQEIEMDMQKMVKVSTLDLHKTQNLNTPAVKIKKVNLQVRLTDSGVEGGTEV
ncbi:extracellular matrix protein FRAS1-like [Patiria miniata]|uniref:VWFC domain-containing protein n=1 Tax=Patiria miniata TaxID=46514 RepID=A0A914AB65_PATMI|nr:extracellular matrix protein FRAS1-like [Patiria miniata]